MTAIDRVIVPPGLSETVVREFLNRAVWSWYDAHSGEVIFDKKFFLVTVKLRIRDIAFVIERIVGPRV